MESKQKAFEEVSEFKKKKKKEREREIFPGILQQLLENTLRFKGIQTSQVFEA